MKIFAIIIIVAVIVSGAFFLFQPSASAPVTTPSTPIPSPTASFSLAEVATHKDSKSCWVAVGGKVYNLTLWINQHPGGPDKILSICGKDGSAAFTAQHEGQNRPEAILATFFIGNLK